MEYLCHSVKMDNSRAWNQQISKQYLPQTIKYGHHAQFNIDTPELVGAGQHGIGEEQNAQKC